MGLLQKDAVDTVDTRLIQFRLGHSCALGFYLGTLLPNLVPQFSTLSFYLNLKAT